MARRGESRQRQEGHTVTISIATAIAATAAAPISIVVAVLHPRQPSHLPSFSSPPTCSSSSGVQTTGEGTERAPPPPREIRGEALSNPSSSPFSTLANPRICLHAFLLTQAHRVELEECKSMKATSESPRQLSAVRDERWQK